MSKFIIKKGQQITSPDSDKNVTFHIHKAGQCYENPDLRELLAELEHQQWIVWSVQIAETEHISEERRERWKKLWRPYNELNEEEKDQDRKWADKVLELLPKEIEIDHAK